MRKSTFPCLLLLAASCSTTSNPGPDQGGLPDARIVSTTNNPDAAVDDDDDTPTGGACPADQEPCDEEAATPTCIAYEKFCDGTMDCPGGQDEDPAECTNPCAPDGGTSTAWPCEDGTCVEESKFCDGTRDCPDGSDEDPAECA